MVFTTHKAHNNGCRPVKNHLGRISKSAPVTLSQGDTKKKKKGGRSKRGEEFLRCGKERGTPKSEGDVPQCGGGEGCTPGFGGYVPMYYNSAHSIDFTRKPLSHQSQRPRAAEERK